MVISRSRLIIAVVSAVLGVLLVSVAALTGIARFLYVPGVICLLVAVALYTRARMGPFLGSAIGSAAFLFGLVYLVNEMISGPLFAEKGSEPSKFNAFMFFVVFGLPGAAYAIAARFGFRDKPEPDG